jgi:hypothetical protein
MDSGSEIDLFFFSFSGSSPQGQIGHGSSLISFAPR